MVPDRLENWTYQSLEGLCAVGQSESDRHDFKFALQERRGTTKLCCAFANSYGGFLVLGVGEKSSVFRIEGLEPNKEIYGQLLAKVGADPEIKISHPKTITIPGSTKLVYVFEIPESPRRPHLPANADERVFWKRVGPNCVQMTLQEVRYQMSAYEEKREKLALLLMELHHILRSLDEKAAVQDGAYTGNVFSFDIIDRVVVESYAILKSDLQTIGALDTLKKRLMTINGEQRKLLNVLAMSYSIEDKIKMTVEFREHVKKIVPEANLISEQIVRSFREKFEIVNPYSSS